MAAIDLSLDLAVALVAVLVAAWFVVAWRRVGDSALLLFGVGLGVKGVGYALGSSAQFDVHRSATALDLARLVIVLAGTLVMVAAYAQRRARPWLFVGWALAAAGVILAALELIVPAFDADLALVSPVAHATIAIANVALALYAAQGFRESPSLARALVPTAFLLWGISNYTWLMIDLGAPTSFGAWVHGWRLLAVLLMLAALVLPRRKVAYGAS